MSIASEITALTADRNAIRTALVNQGVTAASTHGFDDFATDIASISAGGSIEITETLDSHGGTILNITTEGELDLSNDTVAADKLLSGYTAHDASGTAITGTFQIPPAVEKDVNFIDYDGTLLYSYTAAEFADLQDMPANPSHTGLTAQGWNWTLSDAKTYVNNNGKVIIGQNYITSDNNTRLYVTFSDPNTLGIRLYFAVNGSAVVNWGDNTSTETITGSSTTSSKYTNDHIYGSVGSYVITISVAANSTIQFYSSSTNYSLISYSSNLYNGNSADYYLGIKKILRKVEIGSNVRIGQYGLYQYGLLETITIPTGTIITTDAFQYCYILKACVIPNGATEINTNAFQTCRNLKYVSLPNSITTISSGAFRYTNSLKFLTIPQNAKIYQSAFAESGLEFLILPSGASTESTYSFQYCYNIKTVIIHGKLYSQNFYSCAGIETAVFADDAVIDTYYTAAECFSSCSALRSVIFNNTFTTLPLKMFANCINLETVALPNTITSIGATCFGSAYGLTHITIPSTVTSIGNYAFQDCYSLRAIHFQSITPPTLGGSAVFGGVPTSCKIYVPSGRLSAYTSATNYPSSSKYTYIEE